MGMGKSGGGGINLTPSPLEQLQSQVARQTYLETTPLRTGLIANLEDIFGMPRTTQPSTGSFETASRSGSMSEGFGGRSGERTFFKTTPIEGVQGPNPFGMFAGARQNLEAQYPVARENILSTNPSRGGQLNSQLANLDRARATNVGGLRERVVQNALGLASGAAFGAPQTVLGAHDSSAARMALQAQLASANAAGAGGSMAGLFGGLGQLGGAGLGANATKKAAQTTAGAVQSNGTRTKTKDYW